MAITHSYDGLGLKYYESRKGIPRFARFMISHAGLDENRLNLPVNIVELGVGSGQQTEFVEKELHARGITRYKILAYDKSYQLNPGEKTGQLNILLARIQKGELSEKILPIHYDCDKASLPVKSESVDLSYMAHVIHHLKNKEEVFEELARITRKGSRLFVLGVTLENLRNHPLDEFFPTKYKYEVGRYPTRKQLRENFAVAGFTYEKPYRIGKHSIRPIDRAFLTSTENTTIDSAFNIMKDEDPLAFQEGVARVRREVEKAEKTGNYRTHYSAGRLKVFWGIKR